MNNSEEEEKDSLRNPNKPSSSQDDETGTIVQMERRNAVATLDAEKKQLYKDLKSSLGVEEANEHIKEFMVSFNNWIRSNLGFLRDRTVPTNKEWKR
jgi:hypothetical protein